MKNRMNIYHVDLRHAQTKKKTTNKAKTIQDYAFVCFMHRGWIFLEWGRCCACYLLPAPCITMCDFSSSLLYYTIVILYGNPVANVLVRQINWFSSPCFSLRYSNFLRHWTKTAAFHHSFYIWDLPHRISDNPQLGRYEILHKRYTDCIWGILNLRTKARKSRHLPFFIIKVTKLFVPFRSFSDQL